MTGRMKLKRVFKWSAGIIFSHWSSGVHCLLEVTNDCDRETGAPHNPMKAIIHCEYGSPDVLKVEEVEKPVPNDHARGKGVINLD